MHWRQSAILGLIPSILLMTVAWSAKLLTAFSHYSRGDQNGQDLFCLLSLLLRTIRTAGISSGGRRQSRSSSAILWEGRPDWTRDDEAENCWLSAMHFVYMSNSHPLALCLTFFSPSQNLATFGPDNRVLHGSTWCRRTRRVKSGGNDGPGGLDCSMKVSVHFINICPLKKPNFQPLWHASLSRWPPFEHSGTKMGSPDNEALYWTLCLSTISTCSTSKFHLKMSQRSTWGVVMPTANLCAKDCMILRFVSERVSFMMKRACVNSSACPNVFELAHRMS